MNNLGAASNVGAGGLRIVKGRDGGQIKLHRVVIRYQSVWWRRISPRTAGKNSAVDMNHGEDCQGKDHRGIFESEREARG